jgi:gamma-glutamyltranspeptidase/glutathione hydrolase
MEFSMVKVLLLIFFVSVGCTHRVNIVTPDPTYSKSRFEAIAQNNMVASQGEATTKATLEVLKSGGNIIDAFVVASFMISVERPQSTGIGGGGFLLYYNRSENKVYAFDFREMAPVLSKSGMFLSKNGSPQPLLSQEGPLAVATPGLVAGLFEIHQKFGKLPWGELIAPAIKLAREGFANYPHLSLAIADRKHLLAADPDAKKIFLDGAGQPRALGDLIIQEELARTLEEISIKGKDGFYKGKVAKSIVSTIQAKRGILTEKDLRDYKMKERLPVSATYKGLKIFSMPPPSSGGVHVIQILKMLEKHNLKKMGPQSVEAVHLTAQSMQRAFLDRSIYLGDPDFSEVPVSKLLDSKYLNELSDKIKTAKAIKAEELKLVPIPKESSETTHFSIADSDGNLVASTQTINGWFGSGVMAKGTGIILNNEMDDFAQQVGALNLFSAVGGEKNLIQPKKRPLSSMSPTIILKNNSPYMALGSPSGTRIITCVAQTILNAVEFEMPLFESVAATRIHQQWQPDKLKIEAPYLSPKVESELKLKGHDIVHEKLGCSIQAIQKMNPGWKGVSDPRGEGLALGN